MELESQRCEDASNPALLVVSVFGHEPLAVELEAGQVATLLGRLGVVTCKPLASARGCVQHQIHIEPNP
jgi:hypothetical protein